MTNFNSKWPILTKAISSIQRVMWLCVIFWCHYEMRENNYTHLTGRSVHNYKLTVTTKHFWEKKHLQRKKPTLWIKLDIKIKFWHTCKLFRLNPGARGAISHTYVFAFYLPSTEYISVSPGVLYPTMVGLMVVLLTFRLT